MKYNIAYYPQKRKKPTASVTIETDMGLGALEFIIDAFRLSSRGCRSSSLLAFLDPYPEHLIDPDCKDPGNSINRIVLTSDGKDEKIFESVPCSEIDAVFVGLLAYYPIFDIENELKDVSECKSVEPLEHTADITFEYNGDTYTNVSIEKYLVYAYRLPHCVGVRFSAQKNNGAKAAYMLFPQTSFYANPTAEDTDDAEYCDEKAAINASTFSSGIIEVNEKRVYVGTSNIIGGYFVIDDIGEASYKADVAVPVHIFWEKKGKNYSFNILHNGELEKRIVKTENSITFCNTKPLSEQAPAKDIVYRFNKEKGEYICAEHEIALNYFLYDAVLELPAFPKSIDSDTLRMSYCDHMSALYASFANTDRYETNGGNFCANIIHNELLDIDDAPIIKRTEPSGNKYGFELFDTLITVKATVPPFSDFREYNETFPDVFPDFTVDSVTFKNDTAALTIDLSSEPCSAVIRDGKSMDSVCAPINMLLSMPMFRDDNIPFNMVFTDNIEKVVGSLGLYRTLFNIVIENGLQIVKDKLKILSDVFEKTSPHALCAYLNDRRLEITRRLFEKVGLIPSDSITDKALELLNSFDRNHKVPNLAIVGQAGTGKTTLAKNLAGLFNKELLSLAPSDLKGGYIGHTQFEVVTKLADAAMHSNIFYIDEAYQLMNDSFGKEAVALLLPLMTGDRTRVEASLDRGQKDTIALDFKLGTYEKITPDGKATSLGKFPPGVPPFWLSGYEDDILKMISLNKGLYRRLETLTIKPPVTSELMKQFYTELEKASKEAADNGKKSPNRFIIKLVADRLSDYCSKNEKTIRDFFNWGSQVQNSAYFANHAGVTKFIGKCFDSIDPNCTEAEFAAKVEEIITSIKLGIKRQLAVSRDTEKAGDSINVITDIETRFSDLVGCDTQINSMKNIVEMLVNKSVYDSFNLKIPKGALMMGCPGTGKTFAARAMAGELQERFQELAPDKRFGFIVFSGS